MNSRLPQLKAALDAGYVYVVKRGDAYKIGFSRGHVARRVKDSQSELVLTIPTGTQPASLERAIHQHFAAKRTEGPVFKREWFALDESDLAWLRGLVQHVSDHKMR